MKKKTSLAMIVVGLMVAGLTTVAWAEPPEMKMTTDIPASVMAADKVKTSIGTLEYFDGVPTEKTVEMPPHE